MVFMGHRRRAGVSRTRSEKRTEEGETDRTTLSTIRVDFYIYFFSLALLASLRRRPVSVGFPLAAVRPFTHAT